MRFSDRETKLGWRHRDGIISAPYILADSRMRSEVRLGTIDSHAFLWDAVGSLTALVAAIVHQQIEEHFHIVHRPVPDE